MNETLIQCYHWFGRAFKRMLWEHPVELLLLAYGCTGCMVAYAITLSTRTLSCLALVPIFVSLALTINLLVGHGPWRKIYGVCWLPIVPLSLWIGVESWVLGTSFRITLGVLAPLALLAASRAVDNRRFVCDAMTWLKAGTLSLFFSNVVLGLFCAILFSTAYIFGVDGKWVEDTAMYALIFCETVGVPVLLLLLIDRWLGKELRGNRMIDILLTHILTPALLIYLAILYLYILKIVFTWSLPEGGVAYMVFGFTILASIVKALQHILVRRTFDWFFDRFSLFALPPTVLFWVGVIHRIGEYGLTTDRVWLVVCGVVMTLCVLLFLIRRTGHYLYVVLSAFIIFASVLYVPALHPDRIVSCSQSGRLYDSAGNSDSTKNGMEDSVSEQIVVCSNRNRVISIDSYKQLCLDLAPSLDDEKRVGYAFEKDTLRLHFAGIRPDFLISGQELMDAQMKRVGAYRGFCSEEMLDRMANEFLTYSDNELTIFFRNMKLDRCDSVFVLRGLLVDGVLIR